MKARFKMSQADFDKLLEIARNPSPVMYLSGGVPMGPSTQERANAFWQDLASQFGFIWDSAEDAGTGDPTDFLAIPKTEAKP